MSAPNRPTTGSRVGDQFIPAAQRLVGAVRAGSPAEVEAAFDSALEVAAPGRDGIRDLALVLAAMVPEQDHPSILLAWCTRPRRPDGTPYRPPSRNAGPTHGRAKLTSGQVAEIRRTYRPHTPGLVDRLCRKYSVGRSCIYKVVNHETRAAG